MSREALSEEQREIRDLIRALSRERIAPRAAEIDKSSEFPWDVVELFREHDVFGIMFDERYGGAGASALMTLVAIEEVSKVCATSGLILAVQELGSLGIKLAGTEEQKRRFLPKLARGEWLPAYALTEPGSGSDSAAMRSEARREGDEYVINGSKRFITNAGVAGFYVVFAKTDPDAGHAGISAFVVEADTPGFEVGRIEPKMGIKGSTTGELFFNDCRVPADNLLGEEGEGFRIAMRILDRSRPGIGAQGGTAEDLRRVFGDALPNVLPSSSREVLSVGPDVAALRDRAEPYRRLDTGILEALVLKGTLGLSDDDISHFNGLFYARDADEAVAMVTTGEYDAAFLMRPTPIGQVRDLAAAGENMPPKSTYFFPKLLTGLLFSPLA